jgi:hypothetical protein
VSVMTLFVYVQRPSGGGSVSSSNPRAGGGAGAGAGAASGHSFTMFEKNVAAAKLAAAYRGTSLLMLDCLTEGSW